MKRIALLALLAACRGGAGSNGPTAEEAHHPLVGNPGPSLAGDRVIGGAPFNLANEKGRVVVVDFWATWCEPCRKAFPKLQELYVKYASDANASALEIVAVAEDDDSSGITEFAATYDAKFPIVWDGGKKIAGKWQPKSIPATFIVDKQGIVRYVHLGYHDGQESEIEKELKSLL